LKGTEIAHKLKRMLGDLRIDIDLLMATNEARFSIGDLAAYSINVSSAERWCAIIETLLSAKLQANVPLREMLTAHIPHPISADGI
jgi:hypothetical protein